MYGSGHVLLRISQESLDVAGHRLQKLPFVYHCAIPVGELLLPVQLPFGEHVLFQGVVRLDDYQRRGGFKTDAALDADNRVADVDVTPDGKWSGQFLQFFYRIHRIVKPLIADSFQFALRKIQIN